MSHENYIEGRVPGVKTEQYILIPPPDQGYYEIELFESLRSADAQLVYAILFIAQDQEGQKDEIISQELERVGIDATTRGSIARVDSRVLEMRRDKLNARVLFYKNDQNFGEGKLRPILNSAGFKVNE